MEVNASTVITRMMVAVTATAAPSTTSHATRWPRPTTMSAPPTR
jgi:hypothetical protein